LRKQPAAPRGGEDFAFAQRRVSSQITHAQISHSRSLSRLLARWLAPLSPQGPQVWGSTHSTNGLSRESRRVSTPSTKSPSGSLETLGCGRFSRGPGTPSARARRAAGAFREDRRGASHSKARVSAVRNAPAPCLYSFTQTERFGFPPGCARTRVRSPVGAASLKPPQKPPWRFCRMRR
jgi:hypothetical protein